MPHSRYKSRAVRDLAWACFGPPLLQSPLLASGRDSIGNVGLAMTPARAAWLQRLDTAPAELEQFLSQAPGSRLGLYFERLWHFFLARDPAVELVAHNLPVREAGRTVGEFDCLYFCRERQAHFHLELAVKFFLGHRPPDAGNGGSHWRDWLGPNRRDRLDLKLEHLLQHQSRLGRHPAARTALRKLGIDALRPEIEVKGYLFAAAADPLPPPPAFDPRSRMQTWVRIDEVRRWLARQDDTRFVVLPRMLWLGPTRAEDVCALRDSADLLAELEQHFKGDTRPRLVACLGADGGERQRLFVTGPGWPSDRPLDRAS